MAARSGAQPGRLSLAGSAQAAPLAGAPPLPGLEVFEADRAGRFDAPAQADAFARHQLDALRLHVHTFSGEGAVRTLEAGKRYTLTEHPGLGDLAGCVFVPLQVEHEASNNLPGLAEDGQRPAASGLLGGGSYRGRFTAVPEGTPIAPRHRDRPRAPGLQSAIVTGLPNAALTGNREHQVRVQFPWQRGAAPLPGGLADPEHAPGDHTSGTWVRVAEQAAGAHHGQAFLPRVGSEVLVGFAHGDIDQPVIVGRLYNGRHAPPFAAGACTTADYAKKSTVARIKPFRHPTRGKRNSRFMPPRIPLVTLALDAASQKPKEVGPWSKFSFSVPPGRSPGMPSGSSWTKARTN